MAILDSNLEFADAVSVAAGAGTALIGDVIDLSAVQRDIGNGDPMYFVINVSTEIITGGSAGTIIFTLASDAVAGIATDGSATIHYQSHDFITDDVAANSPELNVGGYPVVIALPLQGVPYERFLGVLCTVATNTVTAGAINAFLTMDPIGWKPYPDGSN